MNYLHHKPAHDFLRTSQNVQKITKIQNSQDQENRDDSEIQEFAK